MKKKYKLEGNKIIIPYTPHLPNEAHRAERWSGGRIERNRKKYTRKSKHKGLGLDISILLLCILI